MIVSLTIGAGLGFLVGRVVYRRKKTIVDRTKIGDQIYADLKTGKITSQEALRLLRKNHLWGDNK